MNTITEKVLGIKEKCVIEIFIIHNEGDSILAANGKVFAVCDEDYFIQAIKRKYIKKICAENKCDEEEIVFSLIYWYEYANKKDPKYEASDFIDGDYQTIEDFIKHYGEPNKNEIKIDIVAHGISKMEDNI